VTDTATPLIEPAALSLARAVLALESIAASVAVIAARDPAAPLRPAQPSASYRTVSAPRG
jgi:hypothetical protein